MTNLKFPYKGIIRFITVKYLESDRTYVFVTYLYEFSDFAASYLKHQLLFSTLEVIITLLV